MDTPATASGAGSLSLGVGSQSITGMSTTIGAANWSGAKGCFIKSITLNSDNSATIELMTSFEKKSALIFSYYSYKYSNSKLYIDCKSSEWSSGDIINNGSDQYKKWVNGDDFFISLNGFYGFVGQITSITPSTGIIKVSNRDKDDNIILTNAILEENIASTQDTETFKPYNFTAFVPLKPEVGARDIHFMGLSTGVGNIAAGSLSSAHGFMNTTVGITSAAFGRNNIADNFAAFATGYSNRATGNSSIVAGQGNLATGMTSGAFGYENKVLARNSFALGALNTVSEESSAALGVNNTINTRFGFAANNGTTV